MENGKTKVQSMPDEEILKPSFVLGVRTIGIRHFPDQLVLETTGVEISRTIL
jgi:hypothetical protein